jgi:hypothetical protein
MGAAERLKPSRRQRLNDEIAAAAQQFAAKIVGALIDFELTENDDGEQPKKRKQPRRIPYVPLDEPDSTPEEIEAAREARRRMGP